MNEELLDLVYKLKDSLAKDSRIIKLNELEEKMNNSIDVVKLASKKEAASDDYNFALSHFAKDSKEVEEAQKKLYEAKKELDLNPVVQEYMEQYKIVRDYYKEINDILFSIINKDKCGGCCGKWE